MFVHLHDMHLFLLCGDMVHRNADNFEPVVFVFCPLGDSRAAVLGGALMRDVVFCSICHAVGSRCSLLSRVVEFGYDCFLDVWYRDLISPVRIRNLGLL